MIKTSVTQGSEGQETKKCLLSFYYNYIRTRSFMQNPPLTNPVSKENFTEVRS